MMADVLISEALCFISNNYDKQPSSQLKPILVSFYKEDELVEAKDILKERVRRALTSANNDMELPRLPGRQGKDKVKQTTDDILKLFTIVDEQNLKDHMPRYAAVDLTRVPYLNSDAINTIAMAKKIDALEQRMNSFEHMMTSTFAQSNSELSYDQSHAYSQSAGASTLQSSTSATMNVTGAYRSQDEDVDENVDADDGGSWSVVTSRHLPPKPSSQLKSGMASVRPHVNRQENVHKKRSKLFGAASSSTATRIKSGVEIIRKAVIHVDNLDANCTPQLLEDYLLSNDVSVLSCYATKSWLRDTEKDKVTAFRVCVKAEHRNVVMNANLWSKDIVLRDWKFKGKN